MRCKRSCYCFFFFFAVYAALICTLQICHVLNFLCSMNGRVGKVVAFPSSCSS
jgi:hypothetical protein